MANISMEYGEVESLSSNLDQMNTVNSDMSTEATNLMTKVEGDVEEISSDMNSTFGDMSERLRGEANTRTTQMQGTAWEGNAKVTMDGYVESINGTVDSFTGSSEESMASFKAELMNFIMQYFEGFQGEYNQALTSISEQYTSAMQGTNTTMAGFQEVDSSLTVG